MGRQKLSVSVPEGLARFVDAYRREHGMPTKSQVVARALELLRASDLEEAYARASHELDPDWVIVASDGLEGDAS